MKNRQFIKTKEEYNETIARKNDFCKEKETMSIEIKKEYCKDK